MQNAVRSTNQRITPDSPVILEGGLQFLSFLELFRGFLIKNTTPKTVIMTPSPSNIYTEEYEYLHVDIFWKHYIETIKQLAFY